MTPEEVKRILELLDKIEKCLAFILYRVLATQKLLQKECMSELRMCNECGTIKEEDEMKYSIDDETHICSSLCLQKWMKRRREKNEREEKKKQDGSASSNNDADGSATP